MDELALLYKKFRNINGLQEWKTKINWKTAFLHSLLHVALGYGFYLLATSRVQYKTSLWGKDWFHFKTERANTFDTVKLTFFVMEKFE